MCRLPEAGDEAGLGCGLPASQPARLSPKRHRHSPPRARAASLWLFVVVVRTQATCARKQRARTRTSRRAQGVRHDYYAPLPSGRPAYTHTRTTRTHTHVTYKGTHTHTHTHTCTGATRTTTEFRPHRPLLASCVGEGRGRGGVGCTVHVRRTRVHSSPTARLPALRFQPSPPAQAHGVGCVCHSQP